LADLCTQILQNTGEEAIRLLDDGQSEINMYTSGVGSSNLRLQITDASTKVNNSLLVGNIKDSAGNQSVNITSGQLTLQRPKTTFRDSAYTDRGYLQTQNSGASDGNNTTGYLEWYTGLNARCAFMGLGGSNEIADVSGKSLSLSLEQNYNFQITQGATENFKVSVEDDGVIINNAYSLKPQTITSQFIKSNQANGELYLENTASPSRFRFVADPNHYIQTVNNIITFGKWVDPQFGLRLNHSKLTCEIPYNLICPVINTTSIRLTGQATDSITLSASEVRFKKPLYIEWPNKKFSIQGGATDNVIYEKSGLNLAFNIGYAPSTEVEMSQQQHYMLW
jgi:hypothetical protein